MKKKITGIFVCTLVIGVASLLVAGTATLHPQKQTAASLRGAKETANYRPVEAVAEQILAGPVDRTKDWCNLYGNPYYSITGGFTGLDWYANYQDPEEFGCVDVWPFEVIEICFNMIVADTLTFLVQGFVVDNVGTPSCPFPGDVLCQTPIYQVYVPSAGHVQICLPMTEQCCVNEPYFAAIYIYTDFTPLPDKPDVVTENDPSDACRSYINYGSGWEDLVAQHGWPGEMILNSVGYTSPQNDCSVPECICLEPCSVEVHKEDAVFEFYAVDPDSNVNLTYLLQTVGPTPFNPPFVVITDDDPGYLAGFITWTPNCIFDKWTWYHFELKVTDGEYWDTCHFYAYCYNNPPWVICPPDEEIHDYDTYVGFFFYDDPEDDDVDIELYIEPDPPTSDDPVLDYADGNGTVTWTPNSDDIGTAYLIGLLAIDQCQDFLPCSFVLTVTERPWQDHKMHFPQLPDPNGWDVVATSADPPTWGIVVADDFQCTRSVPITDIHIWGSWKDDYEGEILGFLLSIHSNIPADPETPWSRPGEKLWQTLIGPSFFEVVEESPDTQGWYDPHTGFAESSNHSRYFRYDMTILIPFYQHSGTIYWLSIMAVVVPGYPAEPLWGWKTSRDHFTDAAVWSEFTPPDYEWFPLYEPPVAKQHALDLAFVITGPEFLCGDLTGDGIVELGDVLFLISYLYKGGTAPDPVEVADVDCDGTVELGDVLYLIGYLYKGGSAPCDPDGNGILDC